MNLKSRYKPFVVSPQPCEMHAYQGSQGGSRFRWRDHWPTTLEPTPGRNASGKQAAHGSYYHITKIPIYERSGDSITKIMLHGMTENNIDDVVNISKSWLNPAPIISTYGSNNAFYNPAEKAYELISSGGEMSFMIKGSEQSPVINPVFLVHHWDKKGVTITIDGAELKDGEEYRWDFIRKINGTDLLVWLDKKFSSKVVFIIK
jgi:hypothetical protein